MTCHLTCHLNIVDPLLHVGEHIFRIGFSFKMDIKIIKCEVPLTSICLDINAAVVSALCLYLTFSVV